MHHIYPGLAPGWYALACSHLWAQGECVHEKGSQIIMYWAPRGWPGDEATPSRLFINFQLFLMLHTNVCYVGLPINPNHWKTLRFTRKLEINTQNLYVYILLQVTQKTLSLTEKSWELAGLVMQWCNVVQIQLQ